MPRETFWPHDFLSTDTVYYHFKAGEVRDILAKAAHNKVKVRALKSKSIYTSFTGGKLTLGKMCKSGNIFGWHFN